MYSQVQIPIPIHGNTIECVVKINFVLLYLFEKNYFMVYNAQAIELVQYLYNILDQLQ